MLHVAWWIHAGWTPHALKGQVVLARCSWADNINYMTFEHLFDGRLGHDKTRGSKLDTANNSSKLHKQLHSTDTTG